MGEMSIIGIDLGDLYTKAATLDNGVIENILFNETNRKNYSYITFKDKRLIGIEAFNGLKNNYEKSIFNFNKLIHNLFLNIQNFENLGIINKNEDDDNFIPIKNINNKDYYLHFIYLSYIELTLKALGKNSNDNLVISIPSYFNICDVNFVYDSLKLKLNNFHLVSQEYAISLDYGFYKSYQQKFETEKYVLFINICHNQTQLFLTNFSNEGMNIIRSKTLLIGGNDFTNRLYDHINGIIYKKYNINVSDYPKKKITVLKECEKVKKLLTTLNQANFNIDCLTEDISINESIDRDTFDKITQGFILEIMECLNNLIKEVIKKRLNKELSFTLNAEESISKGCVIYGAINSPIIKNANYKIERFFEEELIMELSHYKNPVIILEKGNNIIPFERKITFNFSDSFNIKFKSELNEVMSFYQVNILNNLNDKKKIEILLEFKLDNQIIIKDYKIYDDIDTKIDIKQIYQSNLNSNDIEIINKTHSDIRLKEEKIDNFHDIINYLENQYYNKFNM